jgi:anthranilate/para-aminobenzoate synthase component II
LCTKELPERFTVHAWIDDMAMAISDPDAKQFAVQFHPESVLTPRGDTLLKAIIDEMSAAA